MWRPQIFRKWRSLFSFQHARHCFCAYGLRIRNRSFHWKVTSLSLGVSVPNTVCTEWSENDSFGRKTLRGSSLWSDIFYPVEIQRWVRQGHSEFATDSASAALQNESSEAQNGPEPDGNDLTTIHNHVNKVKHIVYVPERSSGPPKCS